MAVTETLNEGLKRGYNITIPAADLANGVDAKLKEAQPNVEIKGFRKGKVPMAMLKKQFGPRVMGEVMQETVDQALSTHFKDTGDRPAMQPDVQMTNENWKEGDDIEVSVNYECLPDIPEADFTKVKLKKHSVKAEDADINDALDELAKTSQEFETKKRKSKNGDQVVFDFVGKIDGEAFEGGSAESYPLVLGSNSFIPGFEEQMVGKAAGDAFDVNVTFPADYGAEAMAGKDAVFECKLHEVKAPVSAKIDDELAKKFGAESLADLKDRVRERLEAEYDAASRMLIKRDLMDALDKLVVFDVPQGLCDQEAKQIAHQLWHEENPNVQGHDHPEIEASDEHKTLAERRVRLGLLLADVGQKQKIEVADAEVQQAIMQQAQQYGPQAGQFLDYIKNNPDAAQQFRAPLFEDKVVDFIIELAQVDQKTVDKDKLQKMV